MQPLAVSLQLKRAGRFADALAALNASTSSARKHIEAEVVVAELLERVGRYADAGRLAHELLTSKQLALGERSACHLVAGRVDSTDGRVQSALAHFQRAIAYAEQCCDFERVFWAQLRLFVTVSEQSGPDA